MVCLDNCYDLISFHLNNPLFTFVEQAADKPESDKKSADQDEDSHDETEPANAESDSASEDELDELLERVDVRKEKLKSKLTTLKERVVFWEKRDHRLVILLSYTFWYLFFSIILYDEKTF